MTHASFSLRLASSTWVFGAARCALRAFLDDKWRASHIDRERRAKRSTSRLDEDLSTVRRRDRDARETSVKHNRRCND
jgi:hypothetical protein